MASEPLKVLGQFKCDYCSSLGVHTEVHVIQFIYSFNCILSTVSYNKGDKSDTFLFFLIKKKYSNLLYKLRL